MVLAHQPGGKKKIIELIIQVVASFDMNLITCLSPDFSKDGMGWIFKWNLFGNVGGNVGLIYGNIRIIIR